MSELFDTSAFSSKNDAVRDFEIEDISSKKKVQKSPYKSDSAWDDGSAFPTFLEETWTIEPIWYLLQCREIKLRDEVNVLK